MQLIGYGEDALTLWALQHNLPDILVRLEDDSHPSQCKAFFRPSFGRSGGPGSPQFGEFDFILLGNKCLYLGEAKWDGPKGTKNPSIQLDEVQVLRHRVFAVYVERWLKSHSSWPEFLAGTEIASALAALKPHPKTIPTKGCQLYHNLHFVLQTIREHFEPNSAKPVHVLLYFYDSANTLEPKDISTSQSGLEFRIVPVDYSKALQSKAEIGSLQDKPLHKYIAIRYKLASGEPSLT